MKLQKIGQLVRGWQDGAIWGDLLFRFDARGSCRVFRLGAAAEEIAAFTLDRASEIAPHSNAVAFGPACPGEEFPLLYTNIYNNYARTDDPMKGVCCVYRLRREGESFTTQMVQLIRVGFTEDTSLWCSEGGDVRPYGNFVIDRERGIYYGFTMRDGERVTRYFAFDLPAADAGEWDGALGVKAVTLQSGDIRRQFDAPYHNYLQGACCHGGKIYSVEGFTDDEINRPALRIIDPAAGKQIFHGEFSAVGLTVEPEMIDFMGETCYYGDADDSLYVIDFGGEDGRA